MEERSCNDYINHQSGGAGILAPLRVNLELFDALGCNGEAEDSRGSCRALDGTVGNDTV